LDKPKSIAAKHCTNALPVIKFEGCNSDLSGRIAALPRHERYCPAPAQREAGAL
jgi:hypothetical protein